MSEPAHRARGEAARRQEIIQMLERPPSQDSARLLAEHNMIRMLLLAETRWLRGRRDMERNRAIRSLSSLYPKSLSVHARAKKIAANLRAPHLGGADKKEIVSRILWLNDGGTLSVRTITEIIDPRFSSASDQRSLSARECWY